LLAESELVYGGEYMQNLHLQINPVFIPHRLLLLKADLTE
jgi:hypothetical protein